MPSRTYREIYPSYYSELPSKHLPLYRATNHTFVDLFPKRTFPADSSDRFIAADYHFILVSARLGSTHGERLQLQTQSFTQGYSRF